MPRQDELTFSPIPMDVCHPCAKKRALRGKRDDVLYGLGMPVAVSGIETNRGWVTVRYVCPWCRNIWDCSHACDGETLGKLGQFEDRYVIDNEGVKAYVQDEVPFPAGPIYVLKQTPHRR